MVRYVLVFALPFAIKKDVAAPPSVIEPAVTELATVLPFKPL